MKLFALCLGAASLPAAADVVQVNSSTWFKRSTADSSTLAAADKCWAASGSLLGAGAASAIVTNHYAATLDSAIAGCGFSSGYFYAPHVAWVADPVAAPSPNPAHAWQFGNLSAAQKVDDNLLSPLTIAFGGHKFWKSNNPEIFNGTGWLMQNSRVDPVRGGQANPLTGCTSAYFFHINKTGGTAYLHLLASNPQGAAITLEAKGSAYTNLTKPLTGKATGQSYFVAKDWRDATFSTNFSNRAVGASQVTEIAKLSMANSNMADGRFEVCASAGIYLYTVITTTGTLSDAVNRTQGAPAPGQIYSTGPGTFGREGGVYANSLVAGVTEVVLPASNGQHIGFSFNTTSKNNASLQEQTVPFITRLSDSADRTYGNYGHKFDPTLRLFNTTGSPRNVRISFASSYTAATNTPSFTFSTAASFNGVKFDLWTTPTQPRQVIGTYTVGANAHFDARLTLFVAGLGVTNQQLIVETIN
ncbi:DUF3370 domain-containing protein [Massilia glaciei]|uniref:DUF3370 domain-containing protein n=2 Tax=Massilia glaciei TaxID=1524097 RepID=A0A2U2HMR8_9BURK|nr:DUF3370 domain-containing protein [Massilia glaciei]